MIEQRHSAKQKKGDMSLEWISLVHVFYLNVILCF